MHWIASAGGPLVIVPASLAQEWGGAARGGDGRSHYELACSVDDYIGAVQWRDGVVIVLNDEPLQTTVYEDTQGVMLIRWVYASDEATVAKSLSTVRERLQESIGDIEYSPREREHLIFDSAADAGKGTKTLSILLSNVEYRIRSYIDQPFDDLRLIIHIFDAVDNCTD